MDAAGATYPKTYHGKNIIPYEGVSLLPVFDATIDEREKPIFWKWKQGWAVADKQWKLVTSDGCKTLELHDMYKNRTETNNLAAQNPEVVQRLSKMHKLWLKRCEEQSSTQL